MNAGNEAAGMIMCQTDDCEPDGGIILGRAGIRGSGDVQEHEEEPFHGEQIMPTAGLAQMFNFGSLHLAAKDKRRENL